MVGLFISISSELRGLLIFRSKNQIAWNYTSTMILILWVNIVLVELELEYIFCSPAAIQHLKFKNC